MPDPSTDKNLATNILMEGVKAMLREKLEFEDRDMSKLSSLSGIFRLSGFRCKDEDLDVKIEKTLAGHESKAKKNIHSLD